jgi:O-antigen/teichoic acid export membrane protein
MLSFFPILIETYETEGEAAAVKLMQDIMSVFLVVMLPIVTGISVLSHDIIAAFLGNDYIHSHVMLPWIATGIFFMGLSFFFNKSFELKEKTLLMLFIITGASILNILLNLLLIPDLGGLGAAISTFIAYLCYLLLSVTMGSRILRWGFPWRVFLKALLSSLIMGFTIWFLPCLHNTWGTLFYKIIIGFALYLIFIYLLERKAFRIASNFLSNKKLSKGT